MSKLAQSTYENPAKNPLVILFDAENYLRRNHENDPDDDQAAKIISALFTIVYLTRTRRKPRP